MLHHPSEAAVKSRPDGGRAAIVPAVAAVLERAEVGRVVASGPMERQRMLAADRLIGQQRATDRTPVGTERNRVVRADLAGGDGEAAAGGDKMPLRHEAVVRTAKDRTSSKSEVPGASPERVRAPWKSH